MRRDFEPDFARNRAFYDELAPQYDGQLSCSPQNELARAAFQDLVGRLVSPGSTLLDFGCGTGIDALRYAEHGYRVLAYDNSPGMVAQLAARCRKYIETGAVTARSVEFPSFLRWFSEWSAPAAVVSDFAVLNSIRDLSPLFETFARELAPPGWVIVSVLNPLHWAKLKTPSWWHDAWSKPAGPRLFSRHPYMTYLHFVPGILRAARGFHLVGRANAGRFARYDPIGGAGGFDCPPRERRWWGRADSAKQQAVRFLWKTPAYRLLGHFLFLVLRRDP